MFEDGYQCDGCGEWHGEAELELEDDVLMCTDCWETFDAGMN
jgi:formylmethanofuran dehydrogenase subunit E